ncbi:MAG: hypothetical protein ACP5D2_01840 [Candidatus Nanoarchaeia archaeon]
MKIGFSTGCFWKNVNPVSKKAIELCNFEECNCIEICAARLDRVTFLRDLSKEDFQDFDFVSLHLPCDVRYYNHEVCEKLFSEIMSAHKNIGFDVIVLHPDLVDDWEYMRKFDLPLAIENMDASKPFGKSVDNLLKFSKGFRFVLDINHAFSNDSSGELAKNLHETFRDTLCEFHLSGLNPEGRGHCPLYSAKQGKFINYIQSGNPVIIESALIYVIM